MGSVISSLAIQSWFNAGNNKTVDSEINIFTDKSRCVILIVTGGILQKVSRLDGDPAISSQQIHQRLSEQREQIPSPLKSKIHISLAGLKENVSEIKNLLDKNAGRDKFSRVDVLASPKITCYGNGKGTLDSADFNYDAVVATGLVESIVNPQLQYSNLLPRQY